MRFQKLLHINQVKIHIIDFLSVHSLYWFHFTVNYLIWIKLLTKNNWLKDYPVENYNLKAMWNVENIKAKKNKLYEGRKSFFCILEQLSIPSTSEFFKLYSQSVPNIRNPWRHAWFCEWYDQIKSDIFKSDCFI